ncbi:hypothetical protein AAG906_018346 [Vitis piasezkii]
MPKEDCLLLLQGTKYTNGTSAGEGRLRHHYIEDKTFTSCCAFSSSWYSSSLDYGGRPTSSSKVQMGSYGSMQFQADANAAGQYDYMVFPMETSLVMPSCSNPSTRGTQINRVPNGMENGIRTPKWMSWILLKCNPWNKTSTGALQT